MTGARRRLPKSLPPIDSTRVLDRELVIQNGIYRLPEERQETARYYFFSFRYTIESDETSLGTWTACLNASARSLAPRPESLLDAVRDDLEEDPRFERDGEDLYTEVLVTYAQLALGANVDVPMVAGSVTLQVPAGTQSGQVFNLRGRGLPRINSSSSGDLHVRLQLWTPDSLTDEEMALIHRLGEVQKVPPARPKGLWSKIRESLGA